MPRGLEIARPFAALHLAHLLIMSFERAYAAIERVRPYFQQDGGDIELVEITAEKIARVRLRGNCVGCPSAALSLYLGLETVLREEVPDLAGVEVVI